MTAWALLPIGLVVGTVVGKTAHEATHAAVAAVLGADDIRVGWIDASVYYDYHGSIWAHRTIGVAPVAVGVLILLPGYLHVFGRFSWDVVDLTFAAAWTWYTLPLIGGGIDDFRFDRERANGMVAEAD